MVSVQNTSGKRGQRLKHLQKTALRPIPLLVFQPFLSRIIRGIAKAHPRIFARLGPHAHKTFLIRPTDMPFVLVLRPHRTGPELFARRDEKHLVFHASITGKFIHLLKLMEAQADGDALFFSRALSVEGDTEAVVCLRNALDDMESNIIDEAAKMLGKPGIAGLSLLRKLEGLPHGFAKQSA